MKAAILLSIAVMISGTQCFTEAQESSQDTQARGYWVDPGTRLMWAARDNGRDVSWKKAIKYCRDLQLAGYSDWRLATLGELESVYDKDASAPGLKGTSGRGSAATWHVEGNLFLTGNQWSSSHSPASAPEQCARGSASTVAGYSDRSLRCPPSAPRSSPPYAVVAWYASLLFPTADPHNRDLCESAFET